MAGFPLAGLVWLLCLIVERIFISENLERRVFTKDSSCDLSDLSQGVCSSSGGRSKAVKEEFFILLSAAGLVGWSLPRKLKVMGLILEQITLLHTDKAL